MALIRAKNELSQFLNRLKSFSSVCEQNFADVNNWLSKLEQTISDPQIGLTDPGNFFLKFYLSAFYKKKTIIEYQFLQN